MLTVMLAFMTVSAADYGELTKRAEASQRAVTAASAKCNLADEKFADFLSHFTADRSFNSSRTHLADVFSIRDIADYRALAVTSGHEAGYAQMWVIDSPSKVRLVCGHDGMPADYSYVFTREGDKWFLTDRVTEDF